MLQGRPGKAGDSCYAFWVSAALILLNKKPLQLLQPAAVAAAVAAAQHPSGGISRTPASPAEAGTDRYSSAAASSHREPVKTLIDSNGDNKTTSSNALRFLSVGVLDSPEEQLRNPDPFHTFFALAGLSLLAHSEVGDAHQHQHLGPGQRQQGWQESCRQLLQPLDPETALPLLLVRYLMPRPLDP